MALIVGIAALACFIASLVGAYWLKNDKKDHFGLWQSCLSSNCIGYTTGKRLDGSLRASQSFSILAAVSTILSVMLCIFRITNCFGGKIKFHFPALTFAASAVFGIISALVFSSNNTINTAGLDYGWSFSLAWTGVAFSVVASALVVLARRSS